MSHHIFNNCISLGTYRYHCTRVASGSSDQIFLSNQSYWGFLFSIFILFDIIFLYPGTPTVIQTRPRSPGKSSPQSASLLTSDVDPKTQFLDQDPGIFPQFESGSKTFPDCCWLLFCISKICLLFLVFVNRSMLTSVLTFFLNTSYTRLFASSPYLLNETHQSVPLLFPP